MPRPSGWWTLPGLIAATVAASPARADSWSPDGSWLAYTLSVRPAADRLGWIFGDSPEAPGAGGAPSRSQLWATRVETGESVLLFETRGALSEPAWSPAGTALAYGHVEAGTGGVRRFSVIVQDDPERRRILRTWSLGPSGSGARPPESCDIDWSADGRHLAVSGHPDGLVVLRASDGRVEAELPGGSHPAWAPEGSRLAFARSGATPSLELFDAASGETRRLAEVAGLDRLPTASWTREADALLFIAHLPEARSGPGGRRDRAAVPGLIQPEAAPPQLRFERVRLPRGEREAELQPDVLDVQHPPFDDLDDLLALTFDQSRDGTDLYYAVGVEAEPSLVIWTHPQNRQVETRYNPLHEGVPVAALRVSPSPTRQELALRFGLPGRLTPPALSDPRKETSLTFLTPDDDARAAWVEAILDAVGQVLDASVSRPPGATDGGPALRPTRLPIPGELADNDPGLLRLRRLAGQGLPLCEAPAAPGSHDPSRASFFSQARLVFAYLREDYPAALEALDAFEPLADSPDRRRRLLGLRAQIALARKDFYRAGAILEYLRDAAADRREVVEETARGPILSPADAPGGWPRVLLGRLDDLKSGRATPESPLAPEVRFDSELGPRILIERPADPPPPFVPEGAPRFVRPERPRPRPPR